MKSEHPFFSIITVCFNSAGTIRRTIQSILEQSFEDYEYLVIDGGSTDGTLQIIQEYEPLFQGKMHWISEKDNGIYDAMNKGIGLAKGKYHNMLNSDDFLYHKDVLREVADEINSNPGYGIYYGIEILRYANGEEFMAARPHHSRLLHGNMIRHQAAFIQDTVHKKYGYSTKYRMVADQDFFIRTFKDKVRFKPMDIITDVFLLTGISHQRKHESEVESGRMLYDNQVISLKKYIIIRLKNLFKS